MKSNNQSMLNPIALLPSRGWLALAVAGAFALPAMAQQAPAAPPAAQKQQDVCSPRARAIVKQMAEINKAEAVNRTQEVQQKQGSSDQAKQVTESLNVMSACVASAWPDVLGGDKQIGSFMIPGKVMNQILKDVAQPQVTKFCGKVREEMMVSGKILGQELGVDLLGAVNAGLNGQLSAQVLANNTRLGAGSLSQGVAGNIANNALGAIRTGQGWQGAANAGVNTGVNAGINYGVQKAGAESGRAATRIGLNGNATQAVRNATQNATRGAMQQGVIRAQQPRQPAPVVRQPATGTAPPSAVRQPPPGG